MRYALDAEHNLVPGEELAFAYMGSGVVTFIDGAGTGFRVAIGTRNLAGVSADGTVYLEDDSAPSVPPVAKDEDTPFPLSEYTNRELEALCNERSIPFKYHPNKATLIGLLTAAE